MTNSRTPAASMKAPTVEIMFSVSQPSSAEIGPDPPRHAEQAGEVHRKERDIEADEHQPEHPAAERARKACSRLTIGVQ